MAESTLTLTRAEIERLLTRMVDVDPVDNPTQVADIIKQGLRQFYFPPPVVPNKPPHTWSFLRIRFSVAVTAAATSVTLPDDFSGASIDQVIWIASDTTRTPMRIVQPKDIDAIESSGISGTLPAYIAFEASIDATTKATRYIAKFRPTSILAGTLQFIGMHLPNDFTSLQLPAGGMQHSETLMASILAAAERHMEDNEGVYWKRFIERLAASIAADEDSASSDAIPGAIYPVSAVSATLDLNYQDYNREVAMFFRFPTMLTAQTRDEVGIIDHCIQSGLRQFYFPPPLHGRPHAHQWGFLEPVTSIATWPGFAHNSGQLVDVLNASVNCELSGTGTAMPATAAGKIIIIDGVDYIIDEVTSDVEFTLTTPYLGATDTVGYVMEAYTQYLLASDIVRIDGDLTFLDDEIGYCPVRMVGENYIRTLRTGSVLDTGRPHMAALVPIVSTGTVPQTFKLAIWPTPDAEYTLEFRATVVPAKLSLTNPCPYGGPQHSQTILASIMACAEYRRDGKRGDRYADYLEKLAASISLDDRSTHPDRLGYNGDNSDWQHRRFSGRDLHDLRRGGYVTYNGVIY